MTEDVRAEAEAVSAPRRTRFRKYGLWAAQALILLALLDGFADFAYPVARIVARVVTPTPQHVAERPAAWADYAERIVPGLGRIVEPVALPGLNVDALGMRSTGTPSREGPRGVLLGSSQAFGYYVADDATVAAAIERRRPDVSVAVIAGPARTAAESMTNWQRLKAEIDAPDFAIFLFSNVELYLACQPEPAPTARQPALIAIPARMLRRVSTDIEKTPCATPEARAAAVERSLYAMRAALAHGRAQNPNFAVVISPLLYGNDSNAALWRDQIDPALLKSLDMAMHDFRARLAAEDLLGVIDLSAAFDGNGQSYFIDSGSHFTPAGAELIAEKILERLPDDFFAGANIPHSPSPAGAEDPGASRT